MDPSMDLPTTTEPPTFNSAQVVNHAPTPTSPQPPPPPPSFSPTPPPYAEMITAAITALKERDGSSRIAIAKYIDRVYTNLPLNHSALLTHHLKRLKNSGYLAMVKHSYMLAGPPGSAPPPLSADVDSNGVGTDVSSLTKRKPGRPPKLKPEAQPQVQAQVQFQDQFQAQLQAQLQAHQQQATQFQPQFQTQPQFIQQQPQYLPQQQFQPDPLLQPQQQFQTQPPTQAYAAPEAQNYAGLGAESVFVSLGLADGPVGVHNPAVGLAPALGAEESTTKRRPGRPRKDGSTVVKLSDQSGGTKRRPGRPPKSTTVDAAAGSAMGTARRGRPRKNSTPGRRGRPRKNAAVAAANGGGNVANIPSVGANVTNVPAGGVPSGAIPTPKRRGRPPRSSGPPTATVGVTDVPIAAAFETENLPNTVGGGVTNNGSIPPLGKRRGRPPKSYSAIAAPPTVKRRRKLSGKPLGRPRKNVTSAASDPKLVVAYEELKGKLEHMQSRIKEAAEALKPCVNAESPAVALAALQELEELASAGVNPVQQN